MKRWYTIGMMVLLAGLLCGCGKDEPALEKQTVSPETTGMTLTIYTGGAVSRAVTLPGDPGTSPDMPGPIENIHLFMYIEPKDGSAAYMEHHYIELPESTTYYVFEAIDVPKCTASFYAIVNAGRHDEWAALSTEGEVVGLTTGEPPSRNLYAGTLLDLELIQVQHSGVIDAGLVASKVDIMYNIGKAISNYNALPTIQKEHGDCTLAKVVSLKLNNVPTEGHYFSVRGNSEVQGHTYWLTGVTGPERPAWINGRYDCYFYDKGWLDVELKVQSEYNDGYEKTTTYNIRVDTPADVVEAPYYLLRFDVVGFSKESYDYQLTASV